jgi:hypothetical protein
MSLTLPVDENNDLFIGSDGALSLSRSQDAVMQTAQQAAQTQLGELLYAIETGMPNFQVIWNGAPNVSQFEAFFRRTVLEVTGVIEVVSLVVQTRNNTLSYSATLRTIYGQAALNG